MAETLGLFVAPLAPPTTSTRQLLAEAGRAFGAAFDPVAAPWNIVRFLVPRLADWSVVALLDADGSLRRAAHAHADPAMAGWLGAVDRMTDADLAAQRRTVLARALRSGRTILISQVADDTQAGLLPPSLWGLETRSLIAVPLGPRRRPLGVLVLGALQPNRYMARDARVAGELGVRAAIVLDMAQRCGAMRAAAQPDRAGLPVSRRPTDLAERARRRAELTRQLIRQPGAAD